MAELSHLLQVGFQQGSGCLEIGIGSGCLLIQSCLCQQGPCDMLHPRHLSQEKSGYALHISPSAQSGGDSGEGLWLKGGAPLGSVVALYPGLVYTPLMYR